MPLSNVLIRFDLYFTIPDTSISSTQDRLPARESLSNVMVLPIVNPQSRLNVGVPVYPPVFSNPLSA